MEMKNLFWQRSGRIFGGAAALLAATLFVGSGVKAYADDAYNMAPPVDQANVPTDTSSVFQWSEVPQNQKVPLTRMVFDKSGYQLYDTVGETILVPFKDDNLYVMKFAVSPDGTTYFVNDGTCPILFLPRDGYLVNQAADGARWYPFTDGFAPSTPVFLGCARSWDDFCDIAWYPGMAIYGGFWCGGPRFAFDALIPCDGFFISIGFDNFPTWDAFGFYVRHHPHFANVGFFPHDFRGFDGHRGGFVDFHGGEGWIGQHIDRGFYGDSHNRVFRGVEGFHGGPNSGGFDNHFDSGRHFDNVDVNPGHHFNGGDMTGRNTDGSFDNHGFDGNRDSGHDDHFSNQQSFGHGGFNGSHGNSGTSTTPPAPPSLGGSHGWNNSGSHDWSNHTSSSNSSGWSGSHNSSGWSGGGWGHH
jgi:hypothetical protein